MNEEIRNKERERKREHVFAVSEWMQEENACMFRELVYKALDLVVINDTIV